MQTYNIYDPNILNNIPIPMYKYYSWDNKFNKRILTDNEIWLSSPDQFNDPFDSTAPFRYNEDEMTPANIFSKLLEMGRKLYPLISENELHSRCYKRQYSGAFENNQYWKDLYPEHKAIMNTFGIFCTTTKKDNLLMWAHYANSHRGFCVGIDKFILYKTIRSTLTKVSYSNKLPVMSLNKVDTNASYLMKILASKSEDWQYEDEYRIIKNDAARTTYILPEEGIKEIILGQNMPELYKKNIVRLAKKRFPQANLFQSHMDLMEYKLNIIPILKK